MDFEQVNRLRDELTFITVHPEKHNQDVWGEAPDDGGKPSACGTVGCLAGNAVVNAGFELDWFQLFGDDGKSRWGASRVKGVRGARGKTIRSVARELFGLTEYQSDRLFDSPHNVANLWEMAIEYSDNRISLADAVDAFRKRADLKIAELKTEIQSTLEKL